MKYGVYLPNFGDFFDPRTLAETAREAEAAGWDGFFIWDHLTHPNHLDQPFADPWVALAAVALATQRMRIGAMVTPIARRRPWKLAKEVVTLDHLCGGRLVFGAGLGTHAVEFQRLGDEGSPQVRAELLDEGLEVLVGLTSGKDFEFVGRHYEIQPTRFLPAALQQPRIPVWIAGRWPVRAPLLRAAKWDGYFPLGGLRDNRFLTPAQMAEIRVQLDAERPGRPTADLVATGWTDGLDPAARAPFFDAYAAAGATWYLEAFDPWHYTSPAARARIRQGPL